MVTHLARAVSGAAGVLGMRGTVRVLRVAGVVCMYVNKVWALVLCGDERACFGCCYGCLGACVGWRIAVFPCMYMGGSASYLRAKFRCVSTPIYWCCD